MCGRLLAGAYGASIVREQDAEALERQTVEGTSTLDDSPVAAGGGVTARDFNLIFRM